MKIGVVGQLSDEIFGVHREYYALAETMGTPVVISPVDKDDTPDIDALILPGGADVDVKRYSFLPSIWNGQPNQYQEYFDTVHLPKYIGQIPIFGICRGLQTLNVAFGGTLYRHLWRHPISAHKTDKVHEVTLYDDEGFNLSNVYGDKYKVNSSHHQAINRLADGFEVLAVAPDGTVEAIEHKEYPIAAVQWHPERIYDPFAINLLKKTFSYAKKGN